MTTETLTITRTSQESTIVPTVVSLSPTGKVALDRDRISYPVPFIPNALETVDKKFLKYDYTYWKGGTKQQATDQFQKQLRTGSKEDKSNPLPRIDLLAGSVQGVFADFDDLEKLSKLIPSAFSTSWSEVRRWLACKFSTGCVFPSASGKAKVFFPFTEKGLTYTKLKNRCKTLLGHEYFEAVDKLGFQHSFINTESYPILKVWLKSSEYTHSLELNNHTLNIKNREESKVIVDACKEDYKWNCYKGILPENMLSDLNSKTKNTHLEAVIRYALGTNTSISTGVAIPQTLAGKTLGIPQRAVGRAIRTLIELGVFKMVSIAKEGYKAAKYAFCGFWVAVASNIFKTDLRGISGRIQTILEGIEDGNYNESLWKLTNFFRSEKEYMEKVLTIPGIQEKTRLAQALNAWTCHTKNDAGKLGMVKYA